MGAAGAGLLFLTGSEVDAVLGISDLLCLTESTAKPRQLIKNMTESIVVILVRNALVFVPNMDSTPEKLSSNPPPLPLWISTRAISKKQTIT